MLFATPIEEPSLEDNQDYWLGYLTCERTNERVRDHSYGYFGADVVVPAGVKVSVATSKYSNSFVDIVVTCGEFAEDEQTTYVEELDYEYTIELCQCQFGMRKALFKNHRDDLEKKNTNAVNSTYDGTCYYDHHL